MLPRSRRLRTPEVLEVVKAGRSARSGVHLSAKVFYPSGAEDVTMRFAAVLSKKVARTAPVRNRTRRALYRAVDRYLMDHPDQACAARAVFFIRSIPVDPARAFAVDLERIFPSFSPRR